MENGGVEKVRAYGGTQFMRRAAVALGALPADVEWQEQLTPGLIRNGVAIGKPRFDRGLGRAFIPSVTLVPEFHERAPIGVSETYEEFLARVSGFERYALTEVGIEKASAVAWANRAATVIVCRHQSTVRFLNDSWLVPHGVTVYSSYKDIGLPRWWLWVEGCIGRRSKLAGRSLRLVRRVMPRRRVRVVAGPISLGCAAELGVINITVDLDMPWELRDTNRDLTPEEYAGCDPRPIAYVAREA